MATQKQTEHQDYKLNQEVLFVGYSDPAYAEDAQAIFKPGQRIRIAKFNQDGGMSAYPVDGGSEGDTVFPEEIQPLTAEAGEAQTEQAEPAAEVAAAKPAKKGPKKVSVSKVPSEALAQAVAESTPKKTAKKVAVKTAAPAEQDQEAAPATHVPAMRIPQAGDGQGDMVLTVQDSEAVAAILAEQDALTAAKALVIQTEETFFTLGGVLAHIYTEGIHKSAGYDGKRGFQNYVERELDIHYRKAMYLISIYTYFRGLGVDEKQLARIGWSKAKELVGRTTVSTFERDIAFAESHSRDELMSHINASYVPGETGEGTQVRKVRFTFSLFADQAETAQRALDSAKQLVGSDDLSQSFEYICAEWSQMSESVEVSLEDAVRHLEAKYNVRLAVVNEGDTSTDGTVAA